jgi:thioredoxin-related protein
MKFIIKLFALFIFITSLNGSELNHADSYTDAIEQGIKEKKSVVLFAHSPYCPWCRKMENETLSNKNVIDYLNNNYVFVSVDLSLDVATEDVPKRFLPQGTPTTYVINPNNQQLMFTMRGFKKVKSFLGRLKR